MIGPVHHIFGRIYTPFLHPENQAGVIEHSLSGDKEVKKAVEVLGDPAEYARITREQDTKRK